MTETIFELSRRLARLLPGDYIEVPGVVHVRRAEVGYIVCTRPGEKFAPDALTAATMIEQRLFGKSW